MVEDALMSFVLWNLSNKFRHISDILYYYRHNPDSSTKTKNKEIISRNSKDRIFVIKKIKEIVKNINLIGRLLKYLSAIYGFAKFMLGCFIIKSAK